MSGSGPLGAEAHICWLGQPAHESAVPAFSDSGPGQCSGSGATRWGFALRGLLRTSWTDSGSSSEGAMLLAVSYVCGDLAGDVKFQKISSRTKVILGDEAGGSLDC